MSYDINTAVATDRAEVSEPTAAQQQNKGGRPKKDPNERKDVRVSSRLTNAQKAAFDANAKALGMNGSAFINFACVDQGYKEAAAIKAVIESLFETTFDKLDKLYEIEARKELAINHARSQGIDVPAFYETTDKNRALLDGVYDELVSLEEGGLSIEIDRSKADAQEALLNEVAQIIGRAQGVCQ